VKNTIVENFGGGDKLASAENSFSLDETPDLSGKVAIVTGGSEGIGYGATHTFLKHGIKQLFVISENKEVADGANKALAQELGQDAADRTTWLHLDLSDWAAIPKVAEQITSKTDRIDILFNNAGRGIMSYELTDYGVDRHMALNHMGHVILTSHLLPLIKETASKGNTVRIVNQASNAHQGAPSDVKFASLEELNQDLGPNGQYGRSKLAGILYAKYLNKHLTSKHPNILVNACHPGFVSTKMSKIDILEPYPLAGYAMAVGMEPFKKDQFEGAVSGVYACTKTEKSGRYYCVPCVDEPGSSQANDMDLAEQMMKLTGEVVASKTASQSVDKGCPIKEDH